MKIRKYALRNICALFTGIMMLFLPCVATFAQETTQPVSAPYTSAESAALIEQSTGKILYAKNASQRRPIASTTKIMTALVALEVCDINELVKVDNRAVGVEGSSMYLQKEQTLTVCELLYGLMLLSGNDAASALAYHCAGSIEGFCELMNAKAAEIGMKNTNFQNPHGLHHEAHYSTAEDMAALAATALQNPQFCDIVRSKFAKIGDVLLKNHNKMLWFYDGADGVKTGYTKTAGRCLVSSATRDGMQLIAVTLKDGDDWDDHSVMLDYGFAHYELKTVCQKREILCERMVFGGTSPNVQLCAAEELTLLLPKGDAPKLRMVVTAPWYVYAPVSGGSAIGELAVYGGGECLGRIDLINPHRIEIQRRNGNNP